MTRSQAMPWPLNQTAARAQNPAAVAGENNELHDHWVDAFGIDIIADYRADEDTIAIIGHTAAPEVEHVMLDTTGDGVGDEGGWGEVATLLKMAEYTSGNAVALSQDRKASSVCPWTRYKLPCVLSV